MSEFVKGIMNLNYGQNISHYISGIIWPTCSDQAQDCHLVLAIDHLSDYVIIAGNPPPMLVLDQNKPTWSTVNQWAPEVDIVLFPFISIA